MRSLLVAAVFGLVGCAAQMQVVGPYGGQLTRADTQQIVALMPADNENMSHTYTRLDVVRPDQVRVTVGGFARDTHGVATSDPSSYTFTATKRNGKWDYTGEVTLERRLTVY
jgi:hypothetical protein